MEGLPSYLLWLPVLVITASLIEAVWMHLRAPGSYDWRAFGVSLLDLVVRNLQRILLPGLVVSPIGEWLWEHRLMTVPLTGVWAFALLFVGQEFCYYWYHRAAHRVRLMWCTHAVHHSPNQLTLAAAYRLGWTAFFSGAIYFFLPLIALGFSPSVVVACLFANLLYQFWLHATWIPKLGPLEYVFNTPSAHRVHHAANLDYLDANYGGVLIVFDRLFGTYRQERAELPCRYGWVQPMNSHNPIKVELHQWVSLFKDLGEAKSTREFLGLLFKPPGWRADGQGQTTEELQARAVGSLKTERAV
ncbi:sterol desaturase family protein [Variovorax sp. PCZ-1]|uniref:sterol desaturase family protein n=1 Tax=Variovorax sp. PCZ-1 TaxID=2835533 RepID=UPI001BCB24ED|nr:sterol desaturase family protein [Variovorax sp. PCZ-1]MBS7806925.1 sterol desaturase family protein [Variovorax sp. PCZ-1]